MVRPVDESQGSSPLQGHGSWLMCEVALTVYWSNLGPGRTRGCQPGTGSGQGLPGSSRPGREAGQTLVVGPGRRPHRLGMCRGASDIHPSFSVSLQLQLSSPSCCCGLHVLQTLLLTRQTSFEDDDSIPPIFDESEGPLRLTVRRFLR
jgi:hypothetical protein